MATIDSVKLPDNSTYDLTDNYSGYQKQTLATPLTINGTQETTVEGALSGLNDYGDALADNLAANEESGAKNLNSYPYYDTTKSDNGIVFTDNGDGTITANNTATSPYAGFSIEDAGNPLVLGKGSYTLTSGITGADASTYYIYCSYSVDGGATQGVIIPDDGLTLTCNSSLSLNRTIIIVAGVTVNNLTFKPMIRDARIIDPTYAPPAKTNLQLTNDKAERNDLSTVHATGSTNTTGVQIYAGMLFYLNSRLCKALQDIEAGNAFTLDTNFKTTSIDDILSIKTALISEISNPLLLSYARVTYNKLGFVCVRLDGCKNLVNATYNDIFTLPLDVPRPSQEMCWNIPIESEVYRIIVNTSGTVRIYPYNGVTGSGNIAETLTYLAQ